MWELVFQISMKSVNICSSYHTKKSSTNQVLGDHIDIHERLRDHVDSEVRASHLI